MSEIFWQGDDTSSPTDFNTAANWSIGYVPGAGDHIIFTPEFNNSCTANMDQGTTSFGDIRVEAGYSADIGSSGNPLTATPTSFLYRGAGTIHADIGAANIPVIVENSGAYVGGKSGVNIIGSNISVLSISGGSCAVAMGASDSATVATARVSGSGRLSLGADVTLTALDVLNGSCNLRCNCPTVKVYAGKLTTQLACAISTKLTAYAGDLILNGSGTIASLLLDGTASVDFSQNGVPRTVSTVQNLGGAITRDPAVITFSATTNADRVVRVTVEPI